MWFSQMWFSKITLGPGPGPWAPAQRPGPWALAYGPRPMGQGPWAGAWYSNFSPPLVTCPRYGGPGGMVELSDPRSFFFEGGVPGRPRR